MQLKMNQIKLTNCESKVLYQDRKIALYHMYH